MGILGFGNAKKIEDLKMNDLKRERLTQEVRQDQLLTRIRNATEQYDSLVQAASEPGMSDAEIDVAAYKLSQIKKTRDRTEQELQETLTKMSVLDSTVDILNQRKELEKNGVWKKINEIPEEQLESELSNMAVERKESQINLNRIVEVFDVDQQTVQSKRSADFRRSRDEIMRARQEKGS